MESITHKRISEKILLIPDHLSSELLQFLDYLLFKKDKDWGENISETERQYIDQGLQDIKNGNLHSHQSVMEEMAEYIKQKSRE